MEVAGSLHLLSESLVAPFFSSLEGAFDRTASKVLRIWSALRAALALPWALLALPIRWAASSIASQPWTYVRSRAPELQEARTLFQLNICCPPLLAKEFGGMSPWRERIADLSEHIRSQNADVVCLQEAYDRKAARTLIDSVSDLYPHAYYDVGPQAMGVHATGLIVLSKVPVQEPEFQFYPYGLGAERYGRKGVFGFKAEGLGRILHTHLQYSRDDARGGTPEEVALRAHQMSIVRGLMRPTEPTLLVGDLNIVSGSNEERSLLSPDFHNLLPPEITSQGTWNGLTLDYVLASRGGGERQMQVKRVLSEREGRRITDHEGLLTSSAARIASSTERRRLG